MQRKAQLILKITAVILLVALFVGIALYVNVLDKSNQGDDVAYRYKVGEKCPDFTIDLFSSAGADGGTFRLEESLGQVIVLNFWYTKCAPCNEELPHFNEAQILYGDSVRILAIHAYDVDVKVDKQKYLDKHGYSDYELTFGIDNESIKLAKKLGNKAAYPMTVILDKEGVIRFSLTEKMSLDSLKEEIEKLL